MDGSPCFLLVLMPRWKYPCPDCSPGKTSPQWCSHSKHELSDFPKSLLADLPTLYSFTS